MEWFDALAELTEWRLWRSWRFGRGRPDVKNPKNGASLAPHR